MYDAGSDASGTTPLGSPRRRGTSLTASMDRPPDAALTRNIVLTGFMGTGKTTVGRRLATLLGAEFVDTDRTIEERHGPIPEIFREHGEGEFRRLEREVAAEVATQRGLVIATGGRMMVDAVNAEALGSTGDVFCLTASLDTIVRRLTSGRTHDERPMLATGDGDVRERIAGLLEERADAYGRFVQIDTEGRSPDQVAASIIALRTV